MYESNDHRNETIMQTTSIKWRGYVIFRDSAGYRCGQQKAATLSAMKRHLLELESGISAHHR